MKTGSITFPSGITPFYSGYLKKRNYLCELYIEFHQNFATLNAYIHVATVSEGFRPSHRIAFPLIIENGHAGMVGSGLGILNPDGRIVISATSNYFCPVHLVYYIE